jgi:hypothetical protein
MCKVQPRSDSQQLTKGKRDTPNKRRLVFMSKPLVFDDRKPADKPKPGHFILTSQGWVKVLRGNRHVPWVRQ